VASIHIINGLRRLYERPQAAGRNQQAALARPVPVYIAYFTAAATTDGNIVSYSDIYGRDTPVRVALNRAAGPRTPATPAVASGGN